MQLYHAKLQIAGRFKESTDHVCQHGRAATVSGVHGHERLKGTKEDILVGHEGMNGQQERQQCQMCMGMSG
jgi:hypothetical protein